MWQDIDRPEINQGIGKPFKDENDYFGMRDNNSKPRARLLPFEVV
jgi:hypothetical protein